MAGPSGSPRPAPTAEEWREKGCCGCEFKDLVCGYRGPELWCDHTRARCEALDNAERFDGAQPPLPEELTVDWLSTIAGLLSVACYLWAWPWAVALPIYTVSCGIFVPQVRQQATMYAHHLAAMWRLRFPRPRDNEPLD